MTQLEGLRAASVLVRGLYEAVQVLGFDAEAFGRRPVANAVLRRSGEWLPLEDFEALIGEAISFTGDRALGLHWGQRSPMWQLDFAPAFVTSSPSLRDALEAILQVQFVFFNRAQCHLVHDKVISYFTFDSCMTSTLATRVLTELALASVVRGFSYFGAAGMVNRVDVKYARPDHAREYERALGVEVHFGQPQTRIALASKALDRHLPSSSAGLHRVLQDRTLARRQEALGELNCAQQVEGHLSAALPRILSVAETARLLGTSDRTLRRWLSEENVSHQVVVDRVQRRRAQELLAAGQLSLKEIAYEVGFKTASGFHRASKRWSVRSAWD